MKRSHAVKPFLRLLSTGLSVRWLALLILTSALLAPLPSRADEYEYGLFERAKVAYERGEYEEAVSRFETLLKNGLDNPALILECHKFLGVSFLFVGNREAAEKHFTELLINAPSYELDAMLFPIEVVDFFVEVRAKASQRLKELAQAKAREEENAKAKAASQRAAELEKLKRNIYMERERQSHSLPVAFLPLGAGQFQNGQKVKGFLFLGGEVALAAVCTITYFLHEDLRGSAQTPVGSTSDRNHFEQLEKGYRLANQISLIALATLVALGAVDGWLNFQAETVRWRPIPEKDVPEHLRPSSRKVSLSPYLGEQVFGLELSSSF